MSLEIERYTGINIADRLTGIRRELYLSCWNYMHDAFGDNVEFERMANHVLYCEQTRGYLYEAQPQAVRYVNGSRPALEKIVKSVCDGLTVDRDKVMALFVYVRDLYHKANGADYFYGGTEEDLIKKGEWFCERVARLMVALCEIAGFAGRIIFHMAAGHLTVEIFFNGRWAYFDPRCGMFYLNEQGEFMSVEEILANREIIFKQSEWVNSFHSPYWSLDYRHHRNFHFCFNPLELQCFGDYSLMDADKYHFEWMPSLETKRPTAQRDSHSRYTEIGMMVLLP